jgi:hypothetical protein
MNSHGDYERECRNRYATKHARSITAGLACHIHENPLMKPAFTADRVFSPLS